MDITWYGEACFKIKGKTATVVIDPFDPEFTGLKAPKELEAQVVLVTHDHKDHNYAQAIAGNPLIVNGPGEYEKAGVSVEGVGSFHDSSEGSIKGKNTIYHILMDNIHIVHLGDIGHLLTDEQMTKIDAVDILMVPVGNGGATVDVQGAAKIVSQLEPKVVIPMHYQLPGLKFEFQPVTSFLEEMGAQNTQEQPKYSITADKLPEETTLVLLSKS